MNTIEIGQIVFSKCGRDKGLAFVVLRTDGEFLYLADGNSRKLSNPKKKKLKHIQPTKHICENIAGLLCADKYLMDSDIKKEIASYRDNV